MTDQIRVTVFYGGAEYVVAGRPLADVLGEIREGASGGEAHWLEVSTGLGRRTRAHLLIGPGTPVAVWEVNRDPSSSPEEDDGADPRDTQAPGDHRQAGEPHDHG